MTWALDHHVVPDPPLSPGAVEAANAVAFIGIGILRDPPAVEAYLAELAELVEAGVLFHLGGVRAGLLALCDVVGSVVAA